MWITVNDNIHGMQLHGNFSTILSSEVPDWEPLWSN